MLCCVREKLYENDGGACKINDVGAVDGIVSVEFFIEETGGLDDLYFCVISLD